ncbi:MAG: glycine cleavage system protein H [Atopostipes sp.]|nr:glycine cleavage system protein H [Atopostipes sp.]
MSVKYTESGLWIEEIEDGYRIGLSEKGQDDVGEVTFVELPDYDKHLEKGDNLLSVEGAKAVTELQSPMSGKIQKIHKELEEDTDRMNSTDRTDNWILELRDVEDFDKTEVSNDPWFD